MIPLSKKWAEHFKPAVEKTIEKYKKSLDTACPLCITDYDIWYSKLGLKTCSLCPWVVFENQHCSGWNNGFTSIVGHYYKNQTIPERIERLEGWLQKINDIIEGV
jgi:hypothetical protein